VERPGRCGKTHPDIDTTLNVGSQDHLQHCQTNAKKGPEFPGFFPNTAYKKQA
jgi:hypothetical protein